MKKFAALSILIAAAACSSQPSEPDPMQGSGNAPGNGSEPGAGTGTGTGTGRGGGDGTGTGGGTTVTKVKSGVVSLTQTSFQAGASVFNSYTAFAAFTESGVAGANTVACKQSTDGECAITECTASAPAQDAGVADAGMPEPVKAPTAGDITVAASQTITLAADDKGAYAAKTGQVELFAPGADIKIDAKGDTVPAFSKTMKGPSAITVTSPSFPAAPATLTLDRTKALPLVWTGGTAGEVTVTISSSANGAMTLLACKYAANANKGTISAGAMGKLVATGSGSIGVSAQSVEAFEQDGWKLQLTASSPAKAGAAFASGLAKIQ
jgi:hypothetical protein